MNNYTTINIKTINTVNSQYQGLLYMNWLKHDTDARNSLKLRKVRRRYGSDGYAIYWFCLEAIAYNVDKDNLNFDLKEDAETIGFELSIQERRVEEIVSFMIEINLFEINEGIITCPKLAERIDKSMTNSPKFRAWLGRPLEVKKQPDVMTSPDIIMTSPDAVMTSAELDKIRLDKIRLDKERDPLSKNAFDVANVINHFNLVTGQKLKPSTKSHAQNINARIAEGHTPDDLKMVIDYKFFEWGEDSSMCQYLRPSTLFRVGNFNGYLQQAMLGVIKKATNQANLDNNWHEDLGL